jgi:lysyl-tRNA synthetase class 2
MVGGFEKVYDMGRVFRNEGVDYSHNPEFTMLEYYWAYADITDNILLHQEMIPHILQEAVGSLHIENEGHMLDFTPPYPVKTFRELVKKYSGIDISDFDDVSDLLAIMKEKGYVAEESTNRGKLLDSLYKQSARPKIIQPTFVTEYPVELKPLAKRAKDPRYAEMFQLVVKGYELSNSYTELNDPLDQRERFEEQARIKEGGEEEDVMLPDEDFVVAMEHGMPPSTGTGIGIDRFVALITGSHTVREVVAFPLVKPVGGNQEE